MSLEQELGRIDHPTALRRLLERCGLNYRTEIAEDGIRLNELMRVHEDNLREAISDIIALSDDMIPPSHSLEYLGRHYSLAAFNSTINTVSHEELSLYDLSRSYKLGTLIEYMTLLCRNEGLRDEILKGNTIIPTPLTFFTDTIICRTPRNRRWNPAMADRSSQSRAEGLLIIHRPKREGLNLVLNDEGIPMAAEDGGKFFLANEEVPYTSTVRNFITQSRDVAAALFGPHNLDQMMDTMGQLNLSPMTTGGIGYFMLGPQTTVSNTPRMGIYNLDARGHVRELGITKKPIPTYDFNSLSQDQKTQLYGMLDRMEMFVPQGVYTRIEFLQGMLNEPTP